MRIIAGPGVAPAKNPFLLSKEEEKEVVKKKYDYGNELRVPRR
jgi:large subunit GTPase 1